ncbi:MAG: type II secretion system protein [Planctomycetales bacterium]|nr:type II secretion system protein [Planctomycetales bacterium]
MPLSKDDSADVRSRARFGFTLIELMVVITLMVSLGGMLTYALASATNSARVKRTQADVITIGQLLQSRVNEVSLAQVSLVYGRSGAELARTGLFTPQGGAPISGPGTQNVVTSSSPTRGQLINFQANERARLILMARRDLARMVLPECQADLLYPPASLQFRTLGPSGWYPNVAQVKPPAQWSRMRTLAGLYSAGDIDAEYQVVNSVNGSTNPATNPEYGAITEASVAGFEQILKQSTKVYWNPSAAPPNPRPQTTWTREHESSECLYLILATTELFGKTAIDKIPPSQIADTDQDGVPEILDAWGNPYAFLRNPIGFQKIGIKNFVPGGSTPIESYPIDPDPFDFLAADFRYDNGTHPTPYAAGTGETTYFPIYLPPVVVSAGLDGEFGMRLTYVNTDSSPEPEIGVNDGYSSSAVQYPGGNSSYGPIYPGVPIVRCPDPYFDVSSVPSNVAGTYQFSISSIATAKTGGGLGAVLDQEAVADNITSLDSGI